MSMKKAVPIETSWPKTTGWFWFYGYPYGLDDDKKPDWSMVQVVELGTGQNKSCVHVRNGHFWYPSEKGVGVFIPAVLPETPDLSSLAYDTGTTNGKQQTNRTASS